MTHFERTCGNNGGQMTMWWRQARDSNGRMILERLERDAQYHARLCGPGVLDHFRIQTSKRIRSIIRRLKICPICRGTGMDTSGRHRMFRCDRCKGTGRID